MNKKILILGASSYVGRALFKKLGPENCIGTFNKRKIDNGIYFNSITMDLDEILTNNDYITHSIILLGDTNPITCFSNIEKSNEINVISIKRILLYLKNNNIKPIFTSSEYVYDGVKGNYLEKDKTNPILLYGKQKLEIEDFLAKNSEEHIILRLGKVVGSTVGDGTLFSNWLKEINEKNEISCAYDQIFSIIYLEDVVDSIIKLVKDNINGTFNLSCGIANSRLDLLNLLINKINISIKKKVDIKIKPCSIDDFSLVEKYPKNVSINSSKLSNKLGINFNPPKNICQNLIDSYYKIT